MTQKEPVISVVIATLNREEPLCSTLRYFLEAERYPSFEVIVVDQSDGHFEVTRDFLARIADRVRYVTANYKSLTKARNEGVQLAKGEIVVFVDDDVEPSPGFLLAHARCYVDPDVVGATGPVLPSDQLLTTRPQIGETKFWALMQQREMRFDVDFSFSAQWAVGCNMSFRRTLVIDLGGFDETFQGSSIGEDAEFSHRARKRGRICYTPNARLNHLQAPSGGCRNAASRREHVREVAFCINYFWYRVEAPVWRRWMWIWRAFRRNVLSRHALAGGHSIQSGVGFAEGIWKSSVHLRRLSREKRAAN